MTIEMPLEFCQHVTATGRRCVLRVDHPGEHDPQPPSAVSVRAIERHEAAVRNANELMRFTVGR